MHNEGLSHPFIYLLSPEVTLHSLLTAGAANVRQNVCSGFLPLKGLFWTGVGGVQVVNLAAKATGPAAAAARLGGGWGEGCRLIDGTSSRCCFWCVLMCSQRILGAHPCLIHPSGLGAALAGTHTRRQRHWSTSEGSAVPSTRMLNHIFIIPESARVAGSAPIPTIQPRSYSGAGETMS